MRVYVEGGGDHNSRLRSDARKGFQTFLKKIGLTGAMPRIIACGSRRHAYEDFITAISNGESAMLLVDSEEPVAPKNQSSHKVEAWTPWEHLRQRKGDGWSKPEAAKDMDCHLMTQVMESWFLADPKALSQYFGKGFKSEKLPKQAPESVPKVDVIRALGKAAEKTKKGRYSKGAHSFQVLAVIDPHKVIAASPWAKRWVEALRQS